MAFTYLVLDSFSIIFLLILYASTREHSTALSEYRYFCIIVLMTIAALFCDLVAWQLDGQAGFIARVLLWLSNISCYVFAGATSLGWFMYVGLKLDRNSGISGLGWALVCLPCAALAIVSALTPVTGWMFSLDASNAYYRGPLSFLQIVIPFGYLIAASVRAGIQAGREKLRQQRREYLYLSAFVIFPMMGGALQFARYGLSLTWPCTALSLMLVYVNLQSQKISLDALTGLNNRGQFDKYLYNCMERLDGDVPFALYMLDIDGFKKINDRFGHTMGDAALVDAAGILKRALGGSNAFLARYGGDEFAVVLHYDDESQVDETVERIVRESELHNAKQGAAPYSIVFSIGYVCNDRRRFRNYQDLIGAADARMYLQKQEHNAVR